MGLIKAVTDAIGSAGSNIFAAGAESITSVFKDQYIEFFTGDSLDKDTLVKRGARKVKNGSNKGDSDVITNGSRIAVPTGTALLLVDNGKVTDFTTEPGLYTWDKSSAPSCIGAEGFGEGLKKSMVTILDRFKSGGVINSEQRIYFVNMLEIVENGFGSPAPLPYRDPEFKNISIRVSGYFTYKIANPITFFEHISGNVAESFPKNPFTQTQLRAEFVSKISEVINKLGEGGKNIPFSNIPSENSIITEFMETALDEAWMSRRGIDVVSVALNPVIPDEKSQERIDEITRYRNYSDLGLTNAYAQMGMTDAYKNAGSNASGAVTGFAGVGMLNMAGNQVGMPNPAQAMQGQPYGQQGMNNPMGGAVMGGAVGGAMAGNGMPAGAVGGMMGAGAMAGTQTGWNCACGQVANTGNFCANCGQKKPEAAATWNCTKCGKQGNDGKFCANCGSPRV
jgi:membrane protease subunit (stomatin/prohibitin family)